MPRFVVKIHWPPQGRSRYGHGYIYLVIANIEERALARVEARWEGKQGGDNPHTTEVVGLTSADLFELLRLPPDLAANERSKA